MHDYADQKWAHDIKPFIKHPFQTCDIPRRTADYYYMPTQVAPIGVANLQSHVDWLMYHTQRNALHVALVASYRQVSSMLITGIRILTQRDQRYR